MVYVPEPSSVGFSIWVPPPDKDMDEFYRLDRRVAELIGKGPGPAHYCLPHITVAGKIVYGIEDPYSVRPNDPEIISYAAPVIRELERFAEGVSASVLSFRGIARGSKWSQALYAHVAEDGNRLLTRTFDFANQRFSLGLKDYMPHFSLMYGTYSAEQMERVLSAIRTEFPWLENGYTFAANRLSVYSTWGAVPDWYEVGIVDIR